MPYGLDLTAAFALACHLAKLYATYCIKGSWVPASALAVGWGGFSIKKLLSGFHGELAEKLKRTGGLSVAKKLMTKQLSPITMSLIYSAVDVDVGGAAARAAPCSAVLDAYCRLKSLLGL
ncbi:MAG: hypothetical protein ACO2PN_16340 [Pyrobaculum sp.]|jgi:hypothetical protein